MRRPTDPPIKRKFPSHFQIREIPIRVRVQNESVQHGGRAEHGHSRQPARGPTEQVAAVRVFALASGLRRHRGGAPTPVRVFGVAGFVVVGGGGGGASPPAATATAATALRQRAGRRRSLPSLGRRHHRHQTPRRGTARPAAAVAAVVPVGQPAAAALATAPASPGRCRNVAV